jgi:hypothetical protein
MQQMQEAWKEKLSRTIVRFYLVGKACAVFGAVARERHITAFWQYENHRLLGAQDALDAGAID